MIFSRGRTGCEPAAAHDLHPSGEHHGKAADASGAGGVPARVRGPYDVAEAPADSARLDVGALKVPVIEGVEVRLQPGSDGTIEHVVASYAGSTLQLSALAAPRGESIWAEVRCEIRKQLSSEGATVAEIDGVYGIELHVRPPTSGGLNDLRIVGVDGPRWLLRALVGGPAAVDPLAAPPLLECLDNLVVERGPDAMPVRTPLPLHPPRHTGEAPINADAADRRRRLPRPRRGNAARRKSAAIGGEGGVAGVAAGASGSTVDLPVGEPAASTYQFYAYPLAILASDARASDWVLSNFIQLEYDNRGWLTDVPLTFYLYDYASSPWLEVVRGTRRWFGSAEICDIVRDGLAAGYYAYVVVDEYYVPRRHAHGLRHQARDLLVHGVGGDPCEFAVLGFDERMRFRSTRMSVSGFQKSYAALDDLDVDNAPVLFYRLRAEPEYGYPPVEYGLNIGLIRQTLDEYLRSADTSAHFQMLRKPRPCTYGVSIYEALEDFLRSYAAAQLRYDPRHLQVLWEHKRLMTDRIRRLAEVLGLSQAMQQEAARVQEAASVLLNDMKRNHLQGGRPGFLSHALRLLEHIRRDEVDLLSRLLGMLEDEPAPPAPGG